MRLAGPLPPSSMSSKHADDKNSTHGPRHRSHRKRAKLRSDFNATCYATNLIMGRRMIASRRGLDQICTVDVQVAMSKSSLCLVVTLSHPYLFYYTGNGV